MILRYHKPIIRQKPYSSLLPHLLLHQVYHSLFKTTTWQKRVSSSRIFQQTFNCSKLTTEAIEKGVKYVKNYIDNRTTSLRSFWCLYC